MIYRLSFSIITIFLNTHRSPGAMALAATTRPDLAKEVSVATAKELRLAGINWCYSPVADINSNPSNPVIGVRSFGDGKQMIDE